jgi:CheY-like chemotaxis protein
MEAIGQLTGGIAHDFNNLLTVFKGGLDIIVKGRQPPNIIDAMQRSVERATSLTRQLLTFSRTQPLVAEVVDPGDELLKVRTMLGHLLPPDVRVVPQVEPGLWRCEIDPNQFEVAIINLVINARDAMPSGGRVEIFARNEILSGEHGLAGEFVAISVRDEGVGMAPEVLSRVFEPFFTTKEPGRGTGLGLSQVYGWTNQSGGAVSVESAPGAGTTFTMRLPRTSKAPASVPVASGTADETGEKGLVLLVEDTPAVARVAAAMLHEIGYDVVAAADADEALRRLSETADVAIMCTDIVMPGAMNGIALAREVGKRRPGLPVLLATGYSREADEGGADLGLPVLRKPYQIDELARALAEATRAAAGSLARPAA